MGDINPYNISNFPDGGTKEKRKRKSLGSERCTKNLMQCVPEFLQVGTTLSWMSIFALIEGDGWGGIVFRTVFESKVGWNQTCVSQHQKSTCTLSYSVWEQK